MRNLLFIIPLLIALSPVAEALHEHGDSHESPCPAVCLGAPCGTQCETMSARWTAPEEQERPPRAAYSAEFVPVVFEDEIFHPPVV